MIQLLVPAIALVFIVAVPRFAQASDVNLERAKVERSESLKGSSLLEIENPCFKKAGTEFEAFRYIQLRGNGAVVVAASLGTQGKRLLTGNWILWPKTYRGPYRSIEDWAKGRKVCDPNKLKDAIARASGLKVLEAINKTVSVIYMKKDLTGARYSPGYYTDDARISPSELHRYGVRITNEAQSHQSLR